MIFDVEGFFPIPGYEGLVISQKGIVKRLPYTKKGRNAYGEFSFLTREREVKFSPQEYMQTTVDIGDKKYTIKLHRLLALTFISNPTNLPQVNHIDGDKYNNELENLEWCSAKHNVIHSYEAGLASNKGERHPQSILNYSLVEELRDKYRSGESVVQLSKEYGIKYHTIWKTVKNVNWKGV